MIAPIVDGPAARTKLGLRIAAPSAKREQRARRQHDDDAELEALLLDLERRVARAWRRRRSRR
jgi:hypothetical protein